MIFRRACFLSRLFLYIFPEDLMHGLKDVARHHKSGPYFFIAFFRNRSDIQKLPSDTIDFFFQCIYYT